MKLDHRTDKRKLGDIGENIACDFLKRRGFEVLERNYLKKWGEIDIVAKKSRTIRFIEVKSVSCTTLESVSHGTSGEFRPKTDEPVRPTNHSDWFRPEDNMHPWKLQRLGRTIQSYLMEKRLEGDWQLDLITVKIASKTRQAKVEMIENIVI